MIYHMSPSKNRNTDIATYEKPPLCMGLRSFADVRRLVFRCAHLFKKDLRRLWILVFFFLAFCVLLCAAVFAAGYLEEHEYVDATSIITAGLLLHMLVFGNLMNVEKYEEKHHAYKLMAPLPVSSVEIVASKFLSILVCVVFGVISIHIIYELFGITGAWRGIRIRYLLLTGSLTLVLNSVSYLGVFRYGFHKVRAGIMGVYILALLAPQLIVFLQQVRETRYFLLTVGEASIPAVLGWIVAALAVFAVCLYASVRAKESREI